MKQEKNGGKTEEQAINSQAPTAENTKQKKTKQNGEKRSFFSKLFKREESQDDSPQLNVQRFNAYANEGLTTVQVEERIAQGLVNKTGKKFSKTYKSIFLGNICTFFNLLCLLAALALAVARAPISQFTFVLIFLCNVVVSIVQEIRAKRKIDKLTILSTPTAVVIRNGQKVDITVEELVVDDILLLSAGQQVPADCVTVEGAAELNESLLTGESVPIKKEDGDFVYAGSFVASGRIAVRVDKIGEYTYISKLTARAKKYKRPNSEIMNSINLFIKIIGVAIPFVAVFMFLNNYKAIGGTWADLQQ
ncbi:MAG: HAD-IC family P-type ATPase, partial [Clostridia bacterium]|nr:HAD-IC family P-type ATPase [Clostridia bacterium]